jgi:hypothetical protein
MIRTLSKLRFHGPSAAGGLFSIGEILGIARVFCHNQMYWF